MLQIVNIKAVSRTNKFWKIHFFLSSSMKWKDKFYNQILTWFFLAQHDQKNDISRNFYFRLFFFSNIWLLNHFLISYCIQDQTKRPLRNANYQKVTKKHFFIPAKIENKIFADKSFGCWAEKMLSFMIISIHRSMKWQRIVLTL